MQETAIYCCTVIKLDARNTSFYAVDHVSYLGRHFSWDECWRGSCLRLLTFLSSLASELYKSAWGGAHRGGRLPQGEPTDVQCGRRWLTGVDLERWNGRSKIVPAHLRNYARIAWLERPHLAKWHAGRGVSHARLPFFGEP